MKASAQPIRPDPLRNLPIVGLPSGGLPQAVLVPIGAGIVAVYIDSGAAPMSTLSRISLDGEGPQLPRPIVGTSLPLLSGGLRHLILLGEEAGRILRRKLVLAAGGRPLAVLDPDWLQSPVRGMGDLVAGLAPAGRTRLVRLALTAALPLFARGGDGAALASFVMQSGAVAMQARSWRPMGGRSGLLSLPVPAGAFDALDSMVVVAEGRIRRIPASDALVERGSGRDLLHLVLPDRLPEGSRLLGLGPQPFVIELADLRPRALMPWSDRRSEVFHRWIIEHLEAEESPRAATIRDEIRDGAGELPEARILHLGRTRSGLLVLAELEASAGPGAVLRATVGDRACEVALDPAERVVCAHLRFAEELPATAPCRIALVRPSGRSRLLHSGGIAAEVATPAAPFTRVPLGLAAPALASALRDLGGRAPTGRSECFGVLPDSPRLAVVTVPGACPDSLRALVASVAGEPKARGVELVLVASEAGRTCPARRLLAEAHATFGLPLRLVAVDPDAPASARLAAGLRAIRSERALLLGGDTLPQGRGWLARWARALRVQAAAPIGGCLLASDGSVIHAGGELAESGGGEAPVLRLRSEALPLRELARGRRRGTRLVTASFAGLGTAGIAAFLGLSERFPDPDVLLSAMAATLPGAATLLEARAVRYAAPSEGEALRRAVQAPALAAVIRDIQAGTE